MKKFNKSLSKLMLSSTMAILTFACAVRATEPPSETNPRESIEIAKQEQTGTETETCEKAKEEERAHFDKKNLNMQYAEESLKKGNIEPSVELYLYPTKTWLKETDGALDFYRNASGLTDIEQIARWVVSQKMLPMLLDKTKKDIGLSNSSQFDTENAKANEALNDAGQRLGNVVIGMNNLEVVEGLSYASKK